VVVSSRSVNLYPTRINKKILKRASDDLCNKDKDLKIIIEQYGYPPLWSRPANFSTLVQIILEQQVSLSSAKAIFNKLKTVAFPITPNNILKLSLNDLNNIGFTRQKASYCLGLAESIVSDVFNLKAVAKLDSNAASEELIKIRGIGPWSADIYLLMALRHPDIWPKGDLALDTAIYQIKGLRKKPTAERLVSITSSWRPWRSVAARILWHFYLSK
jgi:DNA-3-methyladenine glycosylase II